MAGKRSGRTSKTDHVLSLLAGAGVDREGTCLLYTSPSPRD